jgi:hypothetical protein
VNMTKQKNGNKTNRRGDQRGLMPTSDKFEKVEVRPELAGRRQGGRNKLTVICREALATGFESLDGVEGLVAW